LEWIFFKNNLKDSYLGVYKQVPVDRHIVVHIQLVVLEHTHFLLLLNSLDDHIDFGIKSMEALNVVTAELLIFLCPETGVR
jgi:hypothetical protein